MIRRSVIPGPIRGEGQVPSFIDLWLARNWDGQGVYARAACTRCGATTMLGIPAGSGEPTCLDCGSGQLRFAPAAEIGFHDTRPTEHGDPPPC